VDCNLGNSLYLLLWGLQLTVFGSFAGAAEEEDDVWGAAPGQVWQHD